MGKQRKLGPGRYSYEYTKGKFFVVFFTHKIIYDFVKGKHRAAKFWSYELGEVTQNGFKTRLDAIEGALRSLYLQAKGRA